MTIGHRKPCKAQQIVAQIYSLVYRGDQAFDALAGGDKSTAKIRCATRFVVLSRLIERFLHAASMRTNLPKQQHDGMPSLSATQRDRRCAYISAFAQVRDARGAAARVSRTCCGCRLSTSAARKHSAGNSNYLDLSCPPCMTELLTLH